MSQRTWIGFVIAALALGVVLAVAAVGGLSLRALVECVKPTSVEVIALPQDCRAVSRAPSETAMALIRRQAAYYHLTLQNTSVCESETRYPLMEPTFSEAVFPPEARARWRPLYVGCCSYQSGRNVAVVVAEPSREGTILVSAALVQDRWDYLWWSARGRAR